MREKAMIMKKKTLAFLLLGAALLVAVIAAGCGSSAPADAVNKAIQNSTTIKSGHVDYNLVLDITGDASALSPQYKGLLPMHLTVDGGSDFDASDQNNVKIQGDVKLGGLDKIISSLAQAQGASGAESQLGAGIINSLASDIQFVVLNHNLYVKLAGNWYQTPLPATPSGTSGAMTTTASVNSSCYSKAFKDTGKFGANTIFKNLTDAGSESIDGANTQHYTASINFDTLLTQLANTARDCGNASAAGGLEAAKSKIGNVFKTASVDMWVGDDNNFHQIKLNLQLDPSTIAGLMGGSASGSGGSEQQKQNVLKALKSVALTVTLKPSNINGKVTINKPQGNIQNLSDLEGSLGMGGAGLGGSPGGTGSSGGAGSSNPGGPVTLPPNGGGSGSGLNST